MWTAIRPGQDLREYKKYDYVFSGHSHLPHIFGEYYYVDNIEYRNKKRTMFINPGSVGQPRNHNPRAQYAIWDTNNGIYLCEVEYEIQYEMSLYTDDIDMFYRERLKYGI